MVYISKRVNQEKCRKCRGLSYIFFMKAITNTLITLIYVQTFTSYMYCEVSFHLFSVEKEFSLTNFKNNMLRILSPRSRVMSKTWCQDIHLNTNAQQQITVDTLPIFAFIFNVYFHSFILC